MLSTSESGGRVAAVCISREKGTRKRPVAQVELRAAHGIVGDAHAGSERQVSLLCESSIEKMRGLGLDVGPGDFAENIALADVPLEALSVGQIVRIGPQVRLRITQIGKECHTACEIRTLTGACVMPQEGVFAEVLTGGVVSAGDAVGLERDSSDLRVQSQSELQS